MQRLNFNILIGVFGTIVILCVVGGFFLSYAGKQIPDALIAIGSGALNAMGAAFIRPPSSDDAPTPVSVAEPLEVIAVEEKPKKRRKS